MLKDNIRILQSPNKDESIRMTQANMNELRILVPLAGFTIKVNTPLFDIEALSPGLITLFGISANEFEIQITTPEFHLITIVPSLVLEVIDPEGKVIIRVIAPPIVP